MEKHEENFCDLLEQYLNDQEIEEKRKMDEEECEKEVVISSDSPFTLEDTITINDYVNNFLNIKSDASNLMHCGLKDLKCPYVVGISNDFANKNPELVKQGFLLIVTDCRRKRGTYINPVYLRKILEKSDVEREFELFSRQRLHDLEKITSYYSEYLLLKEKVEVNQTFYNLLEEQNKVKKLNAIRKYEEMGEDEDDKHKGRQKVKCN